MMIVGNNLQNNTPSTTRFFNKKIAAILFFGSMVAILIFLIISKPPSDTEKARDAIRKSIPNAEVENLSIADGFAIGKTYVPKDKSQLGAGQLSVFRINKDGSIEYLASASDFNEIKLLELGIPLETQSKLNNISIAKVKESLALTCNFENDNLPGFYGFDGSFNPDGWQIDKSSYFYITDLLGKTIWLTNSTQTIDKKIICVAASDKSDFKVDNSTNIGTYYMKLRFITSNGTITEHDFTFNDDPPSERLYTLDGQKIEIN